MLDDGLASPLGIVADVELLEAQAWAEMHTAWAEQLPTARARVQRWGRATGLATPTLDVMAVNRVIGLGLECPLDLRQIADATEFFRNAGRTCWFLEWSPAARLAHPLVLDAAGAILRRQIAKLFAEVSELRPVQKHDNVTVRQITARDRQTFADIVGPALGIPAFGQSEIVAPIDEPRWHYYIASINGTPAAGATMYVNNGGAWFGLAGTHEPFRSRGAQTALLSRRVQDARSLGCSWVSAETFPPSREANASLRNMTRLGMKLLYERPWYRIDVT